MLSQETIDKFVVDGLYFNRKIMEYRERRFNEVRPDGNYCSYDLFILVCDKEKNKWYMKSTSSNSRCYINITDDNFSDFDLVFNDVVKYYGKHIDEYDKSDFIRVFECIDDYEEWSYKEHVRFGDSYYFIKKGATRNKEKVLKRVKDEIDSLEKELQLKREYYDRVENDEIDLSDTFQ